MYDPNYGIFGRTGCSHLIPPAMPLLHFALRCCRESSFLSPQDLSLLPSHLSLIEYKLCLHLPSKNEESKKLRCKLYDLRKYGCFDLLPTSLKKSSLRDSGVPSLIQERDIFSFLRKILLCVYSLIYELVWEASLSAYHARFEHAFLIKRNYFQLWA